MEKKFLKDTRAATLVEKSEIDQILFRFFLKRLGQLNGQLALEDLLLVRFLVNQLYANAANGPTKGNRSSKSKSRIINASPLSGRSRAYYRFAKMSRMELKQFSGAGLLPGFRKSS
jgi:ribosomal protein S14